MSDYMVQALIRLNERENRVLNIIKGKFGLKNKTEAINLIISKYEEEFLEKMKKRKKEPTVRVKNFNKHFGLE